VKISNESRNWHAYMNTSSNSPAMDAGTHTPPPLVKLMLEMGPLVVFFLTNAYAERLWGVPSDQRIFWATGLFMSATLVSMCVNYVFYRHIPLMPMVSCVVVMVFGGLTIWLNDDIFIKLKPTIVNGLFGCILLGGLVFRRSLLAYVLDSVFSLTPDGWRQLTLRWGLFFLFLAGVNEIVWRNFSTDFWVSFKVFGIMPLTVLFALAQMPLLMRFEDKGTDAVTPPPLVSEQGTP
jgi:intracellular septation protein